MVGVAGNFGGSSTYNLRKIYRICDRNCFYSDLGVKSVLNELAELIFSADRYERTIQNIAKIFRTTKQPLNIKIVLMARTCNFFIYCFTTFQIRKYVLKKKRENTNQFLLSVHV